MPVRVMIRGLFLVLLAAGLSPPPVAAAVPSPAPAGDAAGPAPARAAEADFGGEAASGETREVANWAVASGDHHGLPFVIIDKPQAKVFLFDGRGVLQGSAPALLGLGRGDDSVPGIGQRRLATIRPEERTTPAGRFQAALGRDFEQDILWVDYESSLSLHRVIVGKPKEARHRRLATPTPGDNRISFGCINVPVSFYDKIVIPAFTGTVGIVYILPETKPLRSVFAIPMQ